MTFQPKKRGTSDRLGRLEDRVRSLLFALDYLQADNDRLRDRVAWLERHAVIKQDLGGA